MCISLAREHAFISFIIFHFQVGLGIKPMTPVENMLPYIDHIDTALIMTVEPGFGGQKFMEDMMSKVLELV